MREKLTEFDAAEYINSEERARLYLESCAAADPGDGSLIRAGLNVVTRSQDMSALAREAGLDRAGLIRTLSENGKPPLAMVLKVTRLMALKMMAFSLPSYLISRVVASPLQPLSPL